MNFKQEELLIKISDKDSHIVDGKENDDDPKCIEKIIGFKKNVVLLSETMVI